MELRYQSDHPNQVHQLMVSVSKHFYLLKNGNVRFQEKKFDFNLANVKKSEKEHVVHYLIRDHFSGAFYAEACPSSLLMPVEDFLIRAWSKKDGYIFCGMPVSLSIPNTVAAAFPKLLPWASSLDIELLEVTSGFQGGIRDVPTWEKYLRMLVSLHEETKLSEIQANAAGINNYLNKEHADRPSKIGKWAQSLGTIKLPSGEEVVVHEPDNSRT